MRELLFTLMAGGAALLGARSVALFPDLTGEWSRSETSRIHFVDARTGAATPMNGLRHSLSFSPDGRFEIRIVKQDASTGCILSETEESAGQARVLGGELVLVYESARAQRENSCHPQTAGENAVRVSTERRSFHFDRDGRLCLVEKGQSTCFDRTRQTLLR
jgi:hypothetical protein